jgi:hypothetical protein
VADVFAEWQAKQKLWRDKGLSTRAANVLINDNLLTLDDVREALRKRGRLWFLRAPNCGKVTTQEIGKVLFGEDWTDQSRLPHLCDATLIAVLEARGYTVTKRRG